jgi:hypothetical protein
MSDENLNPPLRRSERTKKEITPNDNVLKESKTNLIDSPTKETAKMSGVSTKRKNKDISDDENVEESTSGSSAKKIQKISENKVKKDAETLKAEKSNYNFTEPSSHTYKKG